MAFTVIHHQPCLLRRRQLKTNISLFLQAHFETAPIPLHVISVSSLAYKHHLLCCVAQALQLLTQLEVLHIYAAPSLTGRALCTLSILGKLRTLDLRGCNKISWVDLQQVSKQMPYDTTLAQRCGSVPHKKTP